MKQRPDPPDKTKLFPKLNPIPSPHSKWREIATINLRTFSQITMGTRTVYAHKLHALAVCLAVLSAKCASLFSPQHENYLAKAKRGASPEQAAAGRVGFLIEVFFAG